uniref:Uncharacterized protein n=1 Tax=Aegilops tauschii subsp. strangulata TaxID=200361 RepID=A0A453IUF2_AEGTS
AAQGVARPSVLPIRERFNTTTPERPRLLPSSRQQQLFPHSAWGLGFPSRSPHLAPRRRRPGRRRGLLAAEGWLRPARARGMRPVPRAMGNGAKAADDVREGQLKLMDQCLAATSLAVVHTALLWGLANLI